MGKVRTKTLKKNSFLLGIIMSIAVILTGIGLWNLIFPHIMVEWSTASEVETLGFNIFRSENEEGPFTDKVNPELVPSKGEVILGSEYQLRDKDVRWGRTYYYMLEEIQLGGGSERFGPIEIQVKSLAWFELAIGLILLLGSFVWFRSANPSKLEVLPS